jgi:hypothetical protein
MSPRFAGFSGSHHCWPKIDASQPHLGRRTSPSRLSRTRGVSDEAGQPAIRLGNAAAVVPDLNALGTVASGQQPKPARPGAAQGRAGDPRTQGSPGNPDPGSRADTGHAHRHDDGKQRPAPAYALSARVTADPRQNVDGPERLSGRTPSGKPPHQSSCRRHTHIDACRPR